MQWVFPIFLGDVNQHNRTLLKQFLEGWSERERDQFVGLRRYERHNRLATNLVTTTTAITSEIG